jgi:hypothetical protein
MADYFNSTEANGQIHCYNGNYIAYNGYYLEEGALFLWVGWWRSTPDQGSLLVFG